MSQPSVEPPINGSLAAEPQDQTPALPTGSPPTKRKLSFDSVPSSQPEEEQQEERPFTQKKETPVLPAAAKKAREPIYGLKKRIDDAVNPVYDLMKVLREDKEMEAEKKENARAQVALALTEAWSLLNDATFKEVWQNEVWEVAVNELRSANKLVLSVLMKDCERLEIKPCFDIFD